MPSDPVIQPESFIFHPPMVSATQVEQVPQSPSSVSCVPPVLLFSRATWVKQVKISGIRCKHLVHSACLASYCPLWLLPFSCVPSCISQKQPPREYPWMVSSCNSVVAVLALPGGWSNIIILVQGNSPPQPRPRQLNLWNKRFCLHGLFGPVLVLVLFDSMEPTLSGYLVGTWHHAWHWQC